MSAPRGWIAEGVILSPCCDLYFDFCGTPQELQKLIDTHECPTKLIPRKKRHDYRDRTK